MINYRIAKLITCLYLFTLAALLWCDPANAEESSAVAEGSAALAATTSSLVFTSLFWWQLLLTAPKGAPTIDAPPAGMPSQPKTTPQPQRLEHIVIGNVQEKKHTIDCINQARELSTDIKAIIDLVLQHSHGLRIHVLPQQKIADLHAIAGAQPGPPSYATYFTLRKEIWISTPDSLPDAFPTTKDDQVGYIAQAFDLAFRDLANTLLTGPGLFAKGQMRKPIATVYAPRTKIEKQRYLTAYNAAEGRIKGLREAIYNKRPLDSTYQKAFATLRPERYQKNGMTQDFLLLSRKAISQLTSAGIELKEGSSYNLDRLFSAANARGTFKVLSKEAQPDDNHVITVECLDPAFQFLAIYDNILRRYTKGLDTETQALRVNFYCRQYFPEAVLKTLFKELYQYDHMLRERVAVHARPARTTQCLEGADDFCDYSDIAKRYNLEALPLTPNTAAMHHMKAEYLLKSNQLDQAVQILTKLIQRGFFVAQSNATLGEIYFYKKDESNAIIYFKRAIKKGLTLSAHQVYAYGSALIKEKQFKAAKKVLAKGCEAMQTQAGVEIALQEACENALVTAKSLLSSSNSATESNHGKFKYVAASL